MIIQCCICKQSIGVKEPYEDTSVSHTYCHYCILEKIREEIKRLDKSSLDFETKWNKLKILATETLRETKDDLLYMIKKEETK